MIKHALKNVIGNYYTKFNFPIVVNSYGRSGSTVLTKSIVKSAIELENYTENDLTYRSVSQSAWDLQNINLSNGIIYKTHDYPPKKTLRDNVRMIYTFADPIDVVLSLVRLYDQKGEQWIKDHYRHLNTSFANFETIVYEDQLQLAQHLDAWLNEDRFPVAFVKYETMWNHQDELSDYLGFKINLPPFEERKAKRENDGDLLQALEATYGSLRDRVRDLESFFTNQSAYRE